MARLGYGARAARKGAAGARSSGGGATGGAEPPPRAAEPSSAAEGLRRALERARVPVYDVAPAVFGLIAETGSAQGIVAIAREPRFTVDRLLDIEGEAPVAVLDEIQDPGNVGAILRTAAALGFRGALLTRGTADPFSPKVVRAAAATIFRFPVAEAESDLAALLDRVHGRGFRVACMARGGIAPEHAFAQPPGRIAVVIGNEGRGIAPQLLARADLRVWVPLEREIESLNAAHAFAIVAYALLAARRA